MTKQEESEEIKNLKKDFEEAKLFPIGTHEKIRAMFLGSIYIYKFMSFQRKYGHSYNKTIDRRIEGAGSW